MKNLAYNCMIHIPQNQKLLAAVYKQREILFHQGEGRVCYHNVALLQQSQTLRGTEVTAALQRSSHIVRQTNLLIMVAADDLKFITGLVRLIVGSNQLLDAQLGKVQLEVAEEVAGITAQAIAKVVLPVLPNRRIIGVAENNLALEIFTIMPQLILYRGELGIKFVHLPSPGHMQVAIARHSDTSPYGT